MRKICVICFKEFETERKNQHCCSKECSKERNRRNTMRYYKEHREELNAYSRAYYHRLHGIPEKEELKEKPKAKSEPIPRQEKIDFPKHQERKKGDPKWIKDYCNGDRLTKIAMLAQALTDYNIAQMSYGKLSVKWETMQYMHWEKQVFARKRAEICKY